MKPATLIVAIAACVLAVPAPDAAAWDIEGAVTYGCHERITMDALREAGYVALPPELSQDDRMLFESVGFECGYLDRNRWALALALGSRYFDVGRYSAVDLSLLTGLHNDPDLQATHCLRAASQDGEEGDADAVQSCRDLIRHELALAWDAGDVDGHPDASVTEDVQVYLLYQGTRAVPVSTFYFHLGRALHVLQDSFTHTYRSADRRQIVEVANWVEDVTGDRSTRVDGPPHDDDMDSCRCQQTWMVQLEATTVQASVDLVTLASMEGTRTDREAALETFMDDWMSHRAGCTVDNQWCGSPDPVNLRERPCGGCSTAGASGRTSPSAWVLMAGVLALALCGLRRRR